MWSDVKLKKGIEGWKPGKAFEYLVVRAFQLDGADVRWPYTVKLGDVQVGDSAMTVEQFDGAVYLGERMFLIESKDLADPVSIDAVAKMRLRVERRPPGTMGLLFSTSGFSTVAEMLAQFVSPLNVLFWTGEDLDAALDFEAGGAMQRGLRLKLNWAMEHGLCLRPLARRP